MASWFKMAVRILFPFLFVVAFCMKRTVNDVRLSALQASGTHSKASTVRMLLELQSTGVLEGEEDERSLRRKIQTAVENTSTIETPYGPMVQQIKIGTKKLVDWDVCNPLAFLSYMSSISMAFCAVMKTAMDNANNGALRLVIYMDEMRPGNPFRQEKARKLMCIYWCFVDWEGWLISRTFAWPCFSILRCSIIDTFDGAVSYLARVILHYFFPSTGESLARGIVLKDPNGEPYVVKANFCGWLCDLAAHRDILCWKGWNANVCCPECDNVNPRHFGPQAPDGTIGLDCADAALFNRGIERTSEQIFNTYDEIAVARRTMTATPFKAFETKKGYTYVENSIMMDLPLRLIYRPKEHTIRDWQHTLACDGVGNTLIRQVIRLIEPHGFTLQHVITFMSLVNLPHKYGKADPEQWLGKTRVLTDTIKSFSSIILNLVQMLYLFLEKYCNIAGLVDVRRMFYLFHIYVGVLSTGPDEAPKYVEQLRRIQTEFHELFAMLSTSFKAKLHQMYHILDGIEWLGKALSCFVTERKHRVVKAASLHVFRHIEHTVLADVLHKQCSQFAEGVDLFKERILYRPSPLTGVEGLLRSAAAVLPCGMLHRGDIVWLRDCRCGRILNFFEFDESIFVHVAILANIDAEPSRLDETRQSREFVDSRSVVDSCTWYYESRIEIKVVIPPLALISLV